jgi:opacity protein-like surface antigen
MQTKRVVLLVAILLAASAALVSADIGENFERAGIALWGGGSFYIDFGRVLDSASKYSYWEVTLDPGVDVYAINNLSFYLNPFLGYSSEVDYAGNTDRNMNFGANLGLRYYFVRDPNAQRGMVPTLGADLGLKAYPGIDDESLLLWGSLRVPFRLYFFINDQLAPYVGLTPGLWYLLTQKDASGTALTYDFKQRFYLDARISMGISFFIANKKAVLFAF